jgi:hypothetical protein
MIFCDINVKFSFFVYTSYTSILLAADLIKPENCLKWILWLE